MRTQAWLLLAVGGLMAALVGCVNVKAPERIQIGSAAPEPVDSRQVPQPQTLEEAQQELNQAYANIRYLEQDNQSLKNKAAEYKRERDEARKQREQYKDRLEKRKGD
jgi:chromosome segregation ATPase